ncbi:MAG: aromatic ring-hydroxylating dioxygenase subunit alpha [Betaproteobacteria bacterium]|nr:aromatic ring-hydroxylating dioxygenase subunit alpha [Betaproteobacteria bacterium]NBY05682.1 aromatic ring-hydroxylating dioxygenase subunit alpha [Betaproteobacteria bacterium]
MSNFIYNAWYVACLSSELGSTMVARTYLNKPVVLYRDQQSNPAALEDACPHRKLPLSMGRLKGDWIECGYHGLTFDQSGICVSAPTQDRVPAFACVHSYPVCERWGLIWIWMGDPKLADTNEIPQIEHYDNPQWHITRGDSLVVQCHYLWLADNLLDPSHVAWVHQSSFASAGTDKTPMIIESDEKSVVCHRWIHNAAPPIFYAPLVKFSGPADRLQHYEVRYPSWAINKTVFTPAGFGGDHFDPNDSLTYIMVSHNFLTPIDEDKTHYFWLQHRNTDPLDESITKRNAEGAKTAFLEDKQVLEAVHKGMKNSKARPQMMGLDAAAIRFRQGTQKIIDSEHLSHDDASL